MRDRVSMWRVDGFEGVDLFQATYFGAVFSRHAHSELAVGVVDRGVSAVTFRGTRHTVVPNRLVIINPGEPHTGGVGSPECPLSYRMLYISPRLFSEMLDVEPREFSVTSRTATDRPATRLVRQLHDQLRPPCDTRRCTGLLKDLLNLLHEEYAAHGERVTTSVRSEHVRIVQSFIDEHLGERITTDDLCDVSGLSPSYLVHTFTEEMGLPPHAYQLNCRIDRAKSLLQGGETLAQVALETGFADQSHFTNQFRKRVGMTPGQYRSEMH